MMMQLTLSRNPAREISTTIKTNVKNVYPQSSRAKPFRFGDRFITNLTKISLKFSIADLIPSQKYWYLHHNLAIFLLIFIMLSLFWHALTCSSPLTCNTRRDGRANVQALPSSRGYPGETVKCESCGGAKTRASLGDVLTTRDFSKHQYRKFWSHWIKSSESKWWCNILGLITEEKGKWKNRATFCWVCVCVCVPF